MAIGGQFGDSHEGDPAIVAFLSGRDFRCPGPCGKNLRGVTGAMCPRCHRSLRLLIDASAPPPPMTAVELARSCDVECPGCGYNLRGSVNLKCPECGRVAEDKEFFPIGTELEREERKARLIGSVKVGSAVSACLLGIAACATVSLILDPRFPYYVSPSDPFLLGSIAFSILWAGVFVSTLRRRSKWLEHGTGMLVFCAVASWVVPVVLGTMVCAGILGR